VQRQNGRLAILVENSWDPEAPPRRSGGLGLKNVQMRLEAVTERRQPSREHEGELFQLVCRFRRKARKKRERRPRQRWKALIVDDEELARHVIRELLQSHAEIEIAAECVNGMEAVKAFAEHKPNLIFLDVQMPKLTGFDVLELIDTKCPSSL